MEDSTKIEMVSNEDDIRVVNEREGLLPDARKVVKSRSARFNCCKGVLIATAISIFIAMIIQVYSDYSNFLETHSLPPAIHSMSSHCMEDMEEHCMTKNYNEPTCMFETYNSSTFVQVVCETSKPKHHMVQTNMDHLLINMTWDTKLRLTFNKEIARCLHLVIWSI